MALVNELERYCNAVLDNREIACQKYKWACLRFLNDLKQRGKWDWDFDETKAERYLNWMQIFRHSKGELAGQFKVPTNYEIFVYSQVYGWLHKNGDGTRRFRITYEQLARKQAKSQNKAIQALWEISMMSELNAEAYVMATKKEQTSYVWGEAEWLVKNCDLTDYFVVKSDDRRQQRVILHKSSGSIFSRLSKEDRRTGDGGNPSFAVIDEYHLHDTTEYYDLMISGMVLRKNPLLSIITTAGLDLNKPCYRVEYNLASKILNPNDPTTDDRYLALICEVDRNETADVITTEDGRKVEPGGLLDELGTEESILKACPVTGWTKTMRDDIKHRTQQAKDSPEKMRGLLTKSYNVWCHNRPLGYLDMARWDACKVTPKELRKIIVEKAEGKCYIGIDLSSKLDLTSVGFVFPYKDEDGKQMYALHSHSFTPSETFHSKIDKDKVPYDVWKAKGYLTMTDGAVIDHGAILHYIEDTLDKNKWQPIEVCVDPWSATAISNELMNRGMTVIDIKQGIITLSEPTKDFRAQVYAKRIVHDNNPLLSWCVGNAVTRSDHNQNIMLDKSKATDRIDALAAIMNAYVRAMANAIEPVGGGESFFVRFG